MREDEILRQNPCRIKGYDRYHTPERPTATIAQVYALADAMPARFAAASGASTRELMHRMGHATRRAALIYQHATSERGREIARAMDRRIVGDGRRSR